MGKQKSQPGVPETKKAVQSESEIEMRDADILELKGALDALTSSGEKIKGGLAIWCGRTLGTIRSIANAYQDAINDNRFTEYRRRKLSAKTAGELNSLIDSSSILEAEMKAVSERSTTFKMLPFDPSWLEISTDDKVSSYLSRVISFVKF